MGRGARRASLAAALLALAGTLGACERKAGLAPVSAILVRSTDLAPALAEAGIDATVTHRTAMEALGSVGFGFDPTARRGYRASVEVVAFSVVPAADGTSPSAEVVLELRLEPTWAAGPISQRTAKGQVRLAGAQRRGAWREALRAAVTEAAAAIALDLRALQRSTEALVGELEAADPRVRERAIRALTARGARSALRTIEPRVRDPDGGVSRAAVDAVVSFRDPASAVVLIEAAQAGDVATTLRLLPVLIELGGPNVEGYLLTIESGHSDPAVRRAASEALTRFRAGPPATAGAKR